MPTTSRKYPEFYGTYCPQCGEPLKIYTRPGAKSLDLDWSEWRAHMVKEHPDAA
jgi:hypothetical protein